MSESEEKFTSPNANESSHPNFAAAEREAKRALVALYAQVPEAVARDVQVKVLGAFSALRERLAQVERERDMARAECWIALQARSNVEAEIATLRGQYSDLIQQVGKVTPGETRHESARESTSGVTSDFGAAELEAKQALESAGQFDDPYATVTVETLRDLLALRERLALTPDFAEAEQHADYLLRHGMLDGDTNLARAYLALRARLAEVERERDDWQRAAKAAGDVAQQIIDQSTELATLRGRFKRYADHDEGCARYCDNTTPCDCGFPEAWYATFHEYRAVVDAARASEGRRDG